MKPLPWLPPPPPLLLLLLLLVQAVKPPAQDGDDGHRRTAMMPLSAAQQSSPSRVGRWEGFVLQLAATLVQERYLSGLHFACLAASQCISYGLLRRLDRQMTSAYTIFVGDVIPSTWPSVANKMIVLVGLTCSALANMTVSTNDVVVLVSTGTLKRGQAARAFETCWQTDLLNVVSVRTHGGTTSSGGLLVYTYDPFFPGQCHDMTPRFAAVWTPRTPKLRSKFGLKGKVSDLGGCPLRVHTVAARPWISLTRVNTSSKFDLRGTFRGLIYATAENLNFTPVFDLPSDGKKYGDPMKYPDFGGLMGDVYYNRCDIGLAWTGSDMQVPYHDRPMTSQTSCATWCLPTGFVERDHWHSLIGEFTNVSWLAIMAAYIVGIIVFRLLFVGKKLKDTWLYALQGLISGIDPVPTRWSSRSFMVFWGFYGLVVTTLYVAALHSISSSNTDDTVFKSVNELSLSRIPLYAAVDYLRTYKRAQWDPSEHRIMSRVIPFEFDQAIPLYGRFFMERNFSLLMDRDACVAYSNIYTPVRQAPVFHHLPNYCLSISTSYNYIMRRRHPLIEKITKIIAFLDQSGLSTFWMVVKPRDFSRIPAPVMTWVQLVPFLRLLGVGFVAASVVFILELLWSSFSRTCIRNRKEEKKTTVSEDPGTSRSHQVHQESWIHRDHNKDHRSDALARQKLLRHLEDSGDVRWRNRHDVENLEFARPHRRRGEMIEDDDYLRLMECVAYLRRAARERSVY